MRSRLACVALTFLAVVAARADESAAIARMAPAVVRIEVVSEEGEGGRMRRQSSVGSGSVIDARGHVLTNYHVAGRGTAFVCRLADGTELPAALVGADAMTDLAVIRLDLARLPAGVALPPPAEFADSSALRTGDVVLSMGCPAGLNQSVTRGIVANPRMVMTRFVGEMDLDGESVGELVRWIGHDAVIFGGNSGGPLVDASGRIVGVNEIGVGSLGGAIPANTAREVAAALIRDGRVRRSWTGIEARPLLRSQAGARGVLVNITASTNLKMKEVHEVMNTIKGFTAEDATVIVGTVIDEALGDGLRVTMVATGLGSLNARPQAKPLQVIKNGTDNMPVASADPNYQDLDTPAVIRRRNRDTLEAMRMSGIETLEIPAFLRKQAD